MESLTMTYVVAALSAPGADCNTIDSDWRYSTRFAPPFPHQNVPILALGLVCHDANLQSKVAHALSVQNLLICKAEVRLHVRWLREPRAPS